MKRLLLVLMLVSVCAVSYAATCFVQNVSTTFYSSYDLTTYKVSWRRSLQEDGLHGRTFVALEGGYFDAAGNGMGSLSSFPLCDTSFDSYMGDMNYWCAFYGKTFMKSHGPAGWKSSTYRYIVYAMWYDRYGRVVAQSQYGSPLSTVFP